MKNSLLVKNAEKGKDMDLIARVNKHQFIDYYINIFNGSLKMTEREREFLHEILYRYLTMMEDGLKEPYIGQLVFSRDSLSEIRKKLKLSNQGLNNYKSQLKAKGIIRETGHGLVIDPKLIPQKELSFTFEVIE